MKSNDEAILDIFHVTDQREFWDEIQEPDC